MTKIKEQIIDNLKEVYDPEIPINVYDLGLIYDIDIKKSKAKITMTLTSPTCPTADYIKEMIGDAAKKVEGVEQVDVILTFEPRWTPQRVSKDAKEELGLSDDEDPTPKPEIEQAFIPNEEKSVPEKVCFNCAVTSDERPILKAYYKGEKCNVCSACLSKF